MGQFDKIGKRRIFCKMAGKIAAIAAGAILSVAATAESIAPAKAALTDKTPYYMCFAYTQDGMFFAGGDFDLRRAQTLVAANCNVPKTLTVVLLRTLMVRRNGRTYTYELPEQARR